MRRIIVPPAAGVFSAVGLLCADRESVRSAAFLRPVDGPALAQAAARCRELEQLALAELGPADTVQVRWRGELRYAGQGFELPVGIDRDATDPAAAARALRAGFAEAYTRTYGHDLGDHAVEFVALRVFATAPSAGIGTGFRLGGARRGASAGTTRRAYFGQRQGHHETPVIDRQALAAGPRQGPLIIEEYEGTTVVPPEARVELDATGSLVITLPEEPVHAL
jgi:N-methylhydantoinase A